MKKWIALCLAVLLCLVLASCGSDEKKNNNTEASKASEQIQVASTPKNNDTTVGGIYIFGSYEQDKDDTNGKEPIEWIVLDKESDGTLVLVSKYALDVKPYNENRTDVTWETSTLRKWLNEDFYNAAFSAIEQGRILTTHVINKSNASYGTK